MPTCSHCGKAYPDDGPPECPTCGATDGWVLEPGPDGVPRRVYRKPSGSELILDGDALLEEEPDPADDWKAGG